MCLGVNHVSTLSLRVLSNSHSYCMEFSVGVLVATVEG